MNFRCCYLQLAFVLTLLFCLQMEATELVRMKFSLKNRDSEQVAATMYVGKTALLKNLDLILDTDVVFDNSGKLISSRGFIKETYWNSTIEFSSFETAKNEEIEALRTSHAEHIIRLNSSHAEEMRILQLSHNEEMLDKNRKFERLQSAQDKEIVCSDGGINQTRSLLPERVQDLSSRGYEVVPGIGYYKFHKKREDFETAVGICEEDGTHLAVLNSEEEFDALGKIMDKNDRWNAWVGVHDPDKNQDFRTIFGTPLNETGFSRWMNAQPNGADEDFCVYFYNGLRDKWRSSGLNDFNCGTVFAFFCEHELL